MAPNAPEAASGLLILDKPAGPTSYDCVHRVKKILDREKVGHCGTLDPLAQGVLILLIGSATRRQESFLEMEKQYWFRAEFGPVTETGDREGKVLETRPWADVTQGKLESVLREYVGNSAQVPPAYSALKYQGKPYYTYARKGISVPRASRPITIHSLSLISFSLPFWEARVVCSRGTYVRTLVENIAEKLGTGAVLDSLIRERVGSYSREQALNWNVLSGCNREKLLSFCRA